MPSAPVPAVICNWSLQSAAALIIIRCTGTSKTSCAHFFIKFKDYLLDYRSFPLLFFHFHSPFVFYYLLCRDRNPVLNAIFFYSCFCKFTLEWNRSTGRAVFKQSKSRTMITYFDCLTALARSWLK